MDTQSVSLMLYFAHSEMINKYANKKNDYFEAKLLENFLQELKNRASDRKNQDINKQTQSDFYDMILDNIKLKNGRTIYNLFHRVGTSNQDTGIKLEDDLASVIASIINLANKNERNSQTYKNYGLGAETGSTGNFSEIIDDLKKE